MSKVLNIDKYRKTLEFPMYITYNYRNTIVKLCECDSRIRQVIENGGSYSFAVYLDDLFRIKPAFMKKSDAYEPLIRYLRNLGIEMKIISRSTKRNILSTNINVINL